MMLRPPGTRLVLLFRACTKQGERHVQSGWTSATGIGRTHNVKAINHEIGAFFFEIKKECLERDQLRAELGLQTELADTSLFASVQRACTA